MMSRHRTVFWQVVMAVVLVLTAGGTATAGTAGTAGTAASGAAPTDVGTYASSAGCGKAPTMSSGTHTIQSGGKSRSFILRIPGGYDRTRPYRLVFGFHWWGGTASDVDTGRTVEAGVWNYYGLQRLANNTTIFVAPQGISNGWANSGGEDLVFVDDMLRRIEADLCVDTSLRFALGFSYGGAMSHALACARANVFRAVAVQSSPGTLSGCSGGTQPIAYMGVHGVSDNITSGRALRDRFVNNNGCTAQNPPEPASGSLTHRSTTYSGCRAGYPVVWAAFDGGHIAAPVDGSPGESGTRTWVPGEIWRFFTQFQGADPGPDPDPDPEPEPGACRVANTINAWNTGLTSEITITNTGSTAVNGWSLVFTLPGGQTITSGWSAAYSPASGQVTATNVGYNAAIAAGASVSIGFQATHTGNTAEPTSYTLNGATCTVA